MVNQSFNQLSSESNTMSRIATIFWILTGVTIASSSSAFPITPSKLEFAIPGPINNIATSDHGETSSDIACDPDSVCLVVYESEDSTGNLDIVGQYVDHQGFHIYSPFLIADSIGEDEQHPAVSFRERDSHFVVVWSHQAPGQDSDISGSYFCYPSTTSVYDFTIVNDGNDDHSPDIVCDAYCAVVWERAFLNESDVYGALIYVSGTHHTFKVASGSEDDRHPAVELYSTGNSSNDPLPYFYILWDQHVGNDWNRDIYARTLDLNGFLGNNHLIAGGSMVEERPAVSCLPSGQCLFSWEREVTLSNHDIYASLGTIDDQDELTIIQSDIPIATGTANQGAPSIVASTSVGSGYHFAITWHDYQLKSWPLIQASGAVRTRRVSGITGAVGGTFAVQSGNGWSTPIPSEPKVTVADGHILYLWQQYTGLDTGMDILGREMTFGQL